jgi:hypothetical protein
MTLKDYFDLLLSLGLPEGVSSGAPGDVLA